MFHRYYGIGQGIGFTNAECEAMWGKIKLDDHDQFLHVDTATNGVNGASSESVQSSRNGATTTADVDIATAASVQPAARPANAAAPTLKTGTCVEVTLRP